MKIKTDATRTYKLLGKIYLDQQNIEDLRAIYKRLSMIDVPGVSKGKVLEYL